MLRTALEAPLLDTAKHGSVTALDAVTTWDEEAGELTVFAVNRSAEESLELTLALGAFGGYGAGSPGEVDGAGRAGAAVGAVELVEAVILHEDDPLLVNTAEDPDRVVPRTLEHVRLEGDTLSTTLPAVSWAMLRLRPRS